MGCPDDWNRSEEHTSELQSHVRISYAVFCMLIPMSATATAGYLLPVVFAIATALPVLAVAWILAFSVQQMGSFYGKMQKVQKWMNLIVGVVFIIIGIYYCWIMYL